MPEDFGKDMLMLGGTVLGFIAAVLTLMEKLLDVKTRLTSLTSRNGEAIAWPFRNGTVTGRRSAAPGTIRREG